jgi:hypothetical protein
MRSLPQRVRQRPHRDDGSVEHHLNGIFGERVLERYRLRDVRVIPRPVALPSRVLPVHRLEDHLTLDVTVEDQRGGVAMRQCRGEHLASHVAIEQATSERSAIGRSLHGAVADDERDRCGQAVGDRPRERIAASGDERNVHTSANRFVDRAAVRVGHLSRRVEKCAVHIDANESNHATV